MRHRLLDPADTSAHPGHAHHRLAALQTHDADCPDAADPAEARTLPAFERPPRPDPDAPPEPQTPPGSAAPPQFDGSESPPHYRISGPYPDDAVAHDPDPGFAHATASLARQRLHRSAARWVEHWIPSGLRGGRLSPGRTGALALVVVAVLAATAVALGTWWQRPVAEPAPALPSVGNVAEQAAAHLPTTAHAGKRGARGTPDPPAPTPASGPIVVSVVGKVNHPGLVTLPDGSRVADALRAAGDPVPGTNLDGLNLARRLDDGEQVEVGAPRAADSEPADSGTGSDRADPRQHRTAKSGKGSGAHTGKVNINRATADQLLGLPGVGPVTARRIVDWRTQHGRFTSVDQLRTVGGIGQSKFDRLRDSVAL